MEFRESRPIYAQIADRIGEDILKGVWAERGRIPSVRELAVSLEVNPNTVMRAYTTLQDREIIYNQRGRGYFVAPGAVERIRGWKRERFISRELPAVFDAMALLDMSLDDLARLYAEHTQREETDS